MNRYGPKAQKEIQKSLHDYGQGKLTVGRSRQAVKSRKQAVAIGISQARKKHYKVPAEED